MPRWRRPSASRLETWERCCAGRKRPCARRSIVRHLTDGTLRRIYDEPLALTAADQAHFDECPECKPRFNALANDGHTRDRRAAGGRAPHRPGSFRGCTEPGPDLRASAAPGGDGLAF